MALTDTQLRQAKPRVAAYKLTDAAGLYLYVAPSGAKSWRYDYRFAGRRETLTLGRYPVVTLAQARDDHMKARSLLARGESPMLTKRRAKFSAVAATKDTFRNVAEAWYAEASPHKSASWREGIRRWLDKQLYPEFGSWPISEIEPADVLRLVRQIAEHHPKTAEYIRQTAARVFAYAIRNLRARQNPAREIAGAIIVPPAKHHKPLAESEIPSLLEKLDSYPGRLSTKLASKALLLTAVRKQELAAAMWDEIDLDAALWRVPGPRTKCGRELIVPLARQAVEVFKELRTLACGSRYVVPNVTTLAKPMSASTLNAAFDRIGLDIAPHSFRASFSTALNERGYRADAIERQLNHVERNRVRGSYNAAEYLAERKEFMQVWADICDGSSANVVPLRRSA